jgi:hypothetical protein
MLKIVGLAVTRKIVDPVGRVRVDLAEAGLADPDRRAGTGRDKRPETGPDKQVGTGRDKQPEIGLGKQVETGRDKRPGIDLDRQVEIGLDRQPGTDREVLEPPPTISPLVRQPAPPGAVPPFLLERMARFAQSTPRVG